MSTTNDSPDVEVSSTGTGDKLTVDQISERILANATKDEHADGNSVTLSVPQSTVTSITEDLGIPKDVQKSVAGAWSALTRGAHHAGTNVLIERVKSKATDEEKYKQSVLVRMPLVPKTLTTQQTIRARSEKTTSFNGTPKTYVGYGQTSTVLRIGVSMQQQVDADSARLKEALGIVDDKK